MTGLSKSCRWCKYMVDIGDEGSMHCKFNLCKGFKAAESCSKFKYFYVGVDTLKVVEKYPIDETVCPGCGATLEWGDAEIEGDTEVRYSVWCPNSKCNWEGDNYYNLVFREQKNS